MKTSTLEAIRLQPQSNHFRMHQELHSMKLIAYETGQILFLVPMDEVRPLAGFYLPELIKEIGNRYALAATPTDIGEAVKNGAKFQVGYLKAVGKTIVINKLDLYNDGVLITTHCTDDTELVFLDLYSWLKLRFGFRDAVSSIRKKYFSSVIVDFEKPLEPLLNSFSEITNDYTKALKSDNDVDVSPSLYRIALAADPRELPQFTQNSVYS